MMIPGLKVVAPSTPADVVGLLAASVRDPDPVVFFESKPLFATSGEVPDGEVVDTARHRPVLVPGERLHHRRPRLDRPHRPGRRRAARRRRHRRRGRSTFARCSRSTPRRCSSSVRRTGRLFTVEENPRLLGWGAEVGFDRRRRGVLGPRWSGGQGHHTPHPAPLRLPPSRTGSSPTPIAWLPRSGKRSTRDPGRLPRTRADGEQDGGPPPRRRLRPGGVQPHRRCGGGGRRRARRYGGRRSPAEAAATADVVVSMLADGDVLTDAYTGPDGVLEALPPGAVCVDMGTSGPVAVAAVRRLVVAAGADLVDAPVSGSTPAAEAGTLQIMVGGEDEAVAKVTPLLEVLGNPIHVGPPGAGATLKLAVNSLLLGLNQALAEAVVLAEAAGVAPATSLDVIAGGAAGAPMVGYRRPQYLDPDGCAGQLHALAGEEGSRPRPRAGCRRRGPHDPGGVDAGAHRRPRRPGRRRS